MEWLATATSFVKHPQTSVYENYGTVAYCNQQSFNHTGILVSIVYSCVINILHKQNYTSVVETIKNTFILGGGTLLSL